MGRELSTGKKANSHPLDWCVEQCWCWDQIIAEIGPEAECDEDVAIWDPAAGYGTSGQALQEWGYSGRIWLSDLVENVDYEQFVIRPEFFAADFLKVETPPEGAISIFSNPPYSYKKVGDFSIGEAYARHALKLATHRVVMIFKLKWLSGGKLRSKLFRHDNPPQKVLYFTQRPSMPPGDMIDALGGRAFRGGSEDYCAVVWDVRNPTEPGETRSIWLPRLGDA